MYFTLSLYFFPLSSYSFFTLSLSLSLSLSSGSPEEESEIVASYNRYVEVFRAFSGVAM